MEEDVDEDMATDENCNRIVESPLYSSITEDESPNAPEYPTQSGSASTKRVYRKLATRKITRIKPFKYDYGNNCFVYRAASPSPINGKKSKKVLERIFLYRPRRLPANKRKAAPRPEGGPLLTAAAPKSPVSVISIPAGHSEADLKVCCCDVDEILNEIINENIAIEASFAKQSNDEKNSEQADSGIVDSEDVDSEIIGSELQTDLVVNNEENDLLLYVRDNKLNLLDLVKALKNYKDKKDYKDKETQTDQEKKKSENEDPTNQPSFLKSQSYAELFKISQYNKRTLLGYYEQARQAILGRKGDMETITTVSRQQEKELEQPREKQQENVDQNRSTLQQIDRASRTTEHTERLIQNSRVPPSLISLQQKQLENQKRFHAQQMQQQFLYQQQLASLRQPQQPKKPQHSQQRFLQPHLQKQTTPAIRNVQQHWDRSPQTASYSMPNTLHHLNHHGASSRQPVSRSQQYRYATERSLYEMQQHEHQNLERLREPSTFPNNVNYYTR